MRPLQYILKKFGYVKLTELDLELAPDGSARPASHTLPPYSFMFRQDQLPSHQGCQCAQGSVERALPTRTRAESQLEAATGPFPYATMLPASPELQPYGLDYSDGDTQIMEAPSVQSMPSFMNLKPTR